MSGPVLTSVLLIVLNHSVKANKTIRSKSIPKTPAHALKLRRRRGIIFVIIASHDHAVGIIIILLRIGRGGLGGSGSLEQRGVGGEEGEREGERGLRLAS